MQRINVVLPAETVSAMDRRLQAYKRSQFLDYAALALLARLRGGHEGALEAVGYEHAARALMTAPAPRAAPPPLAPAPTAITTPKKDPRR